ncbi:cilia- and flagella-associated protein 184 [Dasypus novemcinctus]|uniref:cilia- and flagella-associated protein 184 n=1 Tax=Dasypus novemcinctus TaxID=9361 RepID=UPI00265D7576|nr:coiled-coil domain-containing protein 96 [Dasypus novemcinctus]
MADRSGDGKDAVGEDGDGQSLASRLPSSGTQTPAEPAEPEPEAAAAEASELSVAATEGGAAAAEQAEPGEGPVAVEAAAAAGPEEPAEAEAEPAGPAEAGTEAQPAGEPPKTGSEARSEGLEDEGGEEEEEKEEEREREEHEEGAEQEEEEEQEERKTEAPTQAVPRVSEVSEEEAAPAREAEKEKREEEAAEEEALAKAVERDAAGSHKKSEDEGKGMVLGIEDEDEDEESKDQSWSEEVQKEHEQQLRTELLEQYRALLSERNHYQRYNIYLQHKIYEALRKKKGLDAAEVPDKGSEPEAPEKEQAYLRSLALLEELRKQEADDLAWYHQELNKLKQQCQQKLARVEREWGAFQALKKQVVMQAMGSCRLRGGRQAALREVEQIQALEDKKEKEMSAVRLENVQLKQSLVHFETRMRAQADLTDGLLLIDFEQLKIENQTFNEKVEERNEELLKLRSKVTSNVQVITHVKEKLHFMEIENARKKSHLLDIEAQVALKRDILTKTKQARDSLRIDNVKLNQRCGLLGKESLLRDLEEKVDKTEVLRQRLESLKRHHAGLALSCRGVRQKIREAKAFLPS